MHEIVRAPGGSLMRLHRDNRRDLEVVQAGAMVKAARVEAIGFVAQVGMFQVANLSNLEGQLISQVPLCEARQRALVDSATSIIVAEIAGMTF